MFTALRLLVVAMESIVCVHLTMTVGSGYGGYSLCSLNYDYG